MSSLSVGRARCGARFSGTRGWSSGCPCAAATSQLAVLDALARRARRLSQRAVRAPGAGGTQGKDVAAEVGRREVRRARGVLDDADGRPPTAPAATAGTRATHSRASVAAAWRDVPCRGHGPKAVARRSAVRTRDRTLCAVATSATSVRSPYSASRLRATRAASAGIRPRAAEPCVPSGDRSASASTSRETHPGPTGAAEHRVGAWAAGVRAWNPVDARESGNPRRPGHSDAPRATADRVAGDHHIAAVVEQDGYRAAAGRRARAADRQAIQGERGDTAGGDGGDGGRSTVHHGRIGGDVAEQRGG